MSITPTTKNKTSIESKYQKQGKGDKYMENMKGKEVLDIASLEGYFKLEAHDNPQHTGADLSLYIVGRQPWVKDDMPISTKNSLTHEIVIPGTVMDKWRTYRLCLPEDSTGLFKNAHLSGKESDVTMIDLSDLYAGDVKIADSMFEGSDFVQIHLPEFNKLVSVNRMFAECPKLRSPNLRSLTNNCITSANEMFINCKRLRHTTDGKVFIETNPIESANNIFYGCNQYLSTIGYDFFNERNIECKDALTGVAGTSDGFNSSDDNSEALSNTTSNRTTSPMNITEQEPWMALNQINQRQMADLNVGPAYGWGESSTTEYFTPNDEEFFDYFDFMKDSHVGYILILGITDKAFKELTTLKVPSTYKGMPVQLQEGSEVPVFSIVSEIENNLKAVDLSEVDFSNLDNLNGFFENNNVIETIKLPKDLSNITEVKNAFKGCTNLKSVNLMGLPVDCDETKGFDKENFDEINIRG